MNDKPSTPASAAARIEHRGGKDWSFEPGLRVPVQAGDLFELEAWLKLESGGGSATVCVSTHDRSGQALDWAYGGRSVSTTTDWQRLRTRFVVPEGVTVIQPRLIGYGPATIWLDDYALEKRSSVSALRPPNVPGLLSLSNSSLVVSFNTTNAALAVADRRTDRQLRQQALSSEVIVTGASATRDQIKLKLLAVSFGLEMEGRISLEPDRPEFTFELSARGELPGALRFPHPFASRAGEYLVVPMNEGISYPVEDRSIDPMRLVAYGGHGICMAFWGVTDGAAGHGVIIETPDDAAIQLKRVDGRLTIAPEWDPQRGQFGYARRLRYVFFEQGGHVAIAKRYREHARKSGLLKTLAQKRRENPKVDRLIGAVNVWCWDRDAVSIVRELQSAGIERILWSNQQPPDNLRALNDLGVLTSRYDIYQDVMNPANFKHFRWIARRIGPRQPGLVTSSSTPAATGCAAGRWKATNGQWYPCGVICDKQAPDYARQPDSRGPQNASLPLPVH